MKRPFVIACALATVLTTATACSNDEKSDEPVESSAAAESSAEAPASSEVDKGPVDPHAVIINDESMVPGFTLDNINQLAEELQAGNPELGAELLSIKDAITFEPPQCEPFAPSGVAYVQPILDSPDKLAVREFSNADSSDALSVVVASDPALIPHPDGIEGCETVSKNTPTFFMAYTAEPFDLTVDGADKVTAAKLTLTDTDTPLAGDLGSTILVAYVDIDGARYSVAGTGEVPTQSFESVVHKQAENIRDR